MKRRKSRNETALEPLIEHSGKRLRGASREPLKNISNQDVRSTNSVVVEARDHVSVALDDTTNSDIPFLSDELSFSSPLSSSFSSNSHRSISSSGSVYADESSSLDSSSITSFITPLPSPIKVIN